MGLAILALTDLKKTSKHGSSSLKSSGCADDESIILGVAYELVLD